MRQINEVVHNIKATTSLPTLQLFIEKSDCIQTIIANEKRWFFLVKNKK